MTTMRKMTMNETNEQTQEKTIDLEVPMLPLDQVMNVYLREVTSGPVAILFELMEKEHYPAATAVLPTVKEALRRAVEKFLDAAQGTVSVSTPVRVPDVVAETNETIAQLHATKEILVEVNTTLKELLSEILKFLPVAAAAADAEPEAVEEEKKEPAAT